MYQTIINQDINHLLKLDLDYNQFENKTVLITGATGMIGSYFVHFFAQLGLTKNIKVLAAIRNIEKAKSKFNYDHIEYLVGDITQPIHYSKPIDYIIHTASLAGPKYFLSNPVDVMNANLIGTTHLFEVARHCNTKKVILISSIQAYGELDPSILQIKEDLYGAINPNDIASCYAESKRASEVIAFSYQRQYGIGVHCIRLTHAYGPGMDIYDGRMLADFVRDGVNGKDIVLKSDGLGVRNFIYINDVIAAFLTIMLKGEETVYNISNKECVLRIRDLAQVIVDLFPEKNMSLSFQETSNAGFSNVKFAMLDTTRLETLGWKPHYSIEEGMRQTILSFQEKQ